jgi:hypothetical protein
VRGEFAKCRINYRESNRTRSEIYAEMLAIVNSSRCELLDSQPLLVQMAGLQRHVGRSGRDLIDHRSGSFDDLANAASGAIVQVISGQRGILGVIAYEQMLTASTLPKPQFQFDKLFLFQFDAKIRAFQQAAPTPQWKEDPLPPCPNCKATCTAKLSQTEYRCAECATQFFKEGQEPKPARGQRGEYLAGRIPHARGFIYPGQMKGR